MFSNHIQPDWFLRYNAWTVSVVKDSRAFMVLLLAAMAFVSNSSIIIDANINLYL
ncbi:MAG: hypothetical protein ACJAXM_000992 [Arenicella sp.]|jgi:hypothetical protein